MSDLECSNSHGQISGYFRAESEHQSLSFSIPNSIYCFWLVFLLLSFSPVWAWKYHSKPSPVKFPSNLSKSLKVRFSSHLYYSLIGYQEIPQTPIQDPSLSCYVIWAYELPGLQFFFICKVGLVNQGIFEIPWIMVCHCFEWWHCCSSRWLFPEHTFFGQEVIR